MELLRFGSHNICFYGVTRVRYDMEAGSPRRREIKETSNSQYRAERSLEMFPRRMQEIQYYMAGFHLCPPSFSPTKLDATILVRVMVSTSSDGTQHFSHTPYLVKAYRLHLFYVVADDWDLHFSIWIETTAFVYFYLVTVYFPLSSSWK